MKCFNRKMLRQMHNETTRVNLLKKSTHLAVFEFDVVLNRGERRKFRIIRIVAQNVLRENRLTMIVISVSMAESQETILPQQSTKKNL
jgi:hypothetical protein